MYLAPLLPILDPAALGWQPDAALAYACARWPQQLILRTRDVPEAAQAHWLELFETHYPGRLIWNGHISTTPQRTTTLRHFHEGAIPPADTDAFGISAHSLAAVERARTLGAHWILLSPIRTTASHPLATPLTAGTLVQCLAAARAAQIPVYGLGGLGPDDLSWAQRAGMQGVAGIRSFFS